MTRARVCRCTWPQVMLVEKFGVNALLERDELGPNVNLRALVRVFVCCLG
jgi:hypothetical protein